MGVRFLCSARIYGVRFATGVALRSVWGNCIICVAVLRALAQYASSRVSGRSLVWLKTDHMYPGWVAPAQNRWPLGECLVANGCLSDTVLEQSLAEKPSNVRLGEYLVRTGAISEQDLYQALSIQQNMPFGRPGPVSIPATRMLPVEVALRWKVLPFRAAAGRLFVAGTEVPSEELRRDLHRFSSLEIRFQLITPTDFEEMVRIYLPDRSEEPVSADRVASSV
jgi:hypothetical protein